MRFLRACSSAALVVLGAWALPGCNPSDFNSVLDEAPVVVVGTPGASTGSMFVTALSPPTTAPVAGRLLVTRKDANAVGVADFDMNGKATLHEATDAEKQPLSNYGVFSSAVRADGAILLGTPQFSAGTTTPGGRVSMLSLATAADGTVSFTIQNGVQGTGHLGISVAAGNVTGLTGGVGDFVAIGDTDVEVLGATGTPIAATNATACPQINLSSPTDYYAFRPLAVGDVLTGGLDEIILGGRINGQGQGMVVFLQFGGTAALTCMPKILTHGASGNFGASLAVGDYNGDGYLDLAVGSPPDSVFVYFGPLDAVTDPNVTITSPSATNFGGQIATYYQAGMLSAQLLVSDTTALDGESKGKVMLFSATGQATAMTTANALATLFDSNTGADSALGSNIGGMSFSTGLCVTGGAPQIVPWASTGTDVLTFFTYATPATATGVATDPRCFSLKK